MACIFQEFQKVGPFEAPEGKKCREKMTIIAVGHAHQPGSGRAGNSSELQCKELYDMRVEHSDASTGHALSCYSDVTHFKTARF